MFRKSLCTIALVSICTLASVCNAQGGGGGGRGGGGSVKPLTIRWVGTITAIAPKADGAVVTLGTSYYAVGTGTVDSSTKIKLNGTSSGVTAGDLRLGDVAQMDVLWPSRVVVKMEVTGAR